MNEIPEELLLYRAQLRDAIERDLRHRVPRLRVLQPPPVRLAIPALAVLAAATAVVLGLTLSASPESASAAARRALAATAAAPSGTVTMTVLHGGVTHTLESTRWNGGNIAWSPGAGSIFSPADSSIQQLLLIGGGAYVQKTDGTWLHYANTSDVAPKPLGGMLHLAHDNIAGASAQQILALANRVQKTTQSDGATLYTGTIPSNANPGNAPGDDAIIRMIFGSRKVTQGEAGGGLLSDSQLRMSVGGDGLVRQVSVSFQQEGTSSAARDGTYTWSVTYSQLGSTPPITAPASSTDVPPGTLPQNR